MIRRLRYWIEMIRRGVRCRCCATCEFYEVCRMQTEQEDAETAGKKRGDVVERNEESVSERARLKRYLARYYHAKMRKRQLDLRLRTFREDRGEDGGSETSAMAAEIEDKIESQKAELTRCMADVMEIIELLPEESTERIVMEYRHIDCMTWQQVCKTMHYSRSSVNSYYVRGLDRLLKQEKARNKIKSGHNWTLSNDKMVKEQS